MHSDCQEVEKRMTEYMCFQPLLLMAIFFQYNINNYQNLYEKNKEKYLSTMKALLRHLVLEEVT